MTSGALFIISIYCSDKKKNTINVPHFAFKKKFKKLKYQYKNVKN